MSEILCACVGTGQSGKSGGAQAMPVGAVVAVVGRSNQDIVVSLAEEDQKAMQHRQSSTRSVSSTAALTQASIRNLFVLPSGSEQITETVNIQQ